MGLTLVIPPSLGHDKTSGLADTLATALSKHLQLTIEVEVARTYAALEERARSGEPALVWAPPVVCARVQDGARAILKAVRGGSATYRAALFCRASSSIDLDELDEVRAAWVDPLSTAGYLLPRQYLRDSGVDPDMALPSQRFFGSFGDAARSIVQRHADLSSIFCAGNDPAIATANLVAQLGADDAAQLRVLAVTAETASDGLIVSASVSDVVAGRLVESLLASGGDGPDLVRGVFDAETLMVAGPDDYEAIRAALANEE